MEKWTLRRKPLAAAAALVAGLSALSGGFGLTRPADARDKGPSLPLATTVDDVFQRGTQPEMPGFALMRSSTDCAFCHAGYGEEDVEPYTTWAASMPGQSARDPIFWANLAIVNQDAAHVGEYCLRCHAPNAFLEGRTDPPDGSAFLPIDSDGVSCNLCHRMVNPDYVVGVSPTQDETIVDDLAMADLLPSDGSNARYVVDPADSRRGPFDDLPFNPHFGAPQPEVIYSPMHHESEFCWTCHDVSNPLFEKQEDGTFVMGDLGQPHPTGEQEDMFPLHRTYAEWKNSYYFTLGGIQHNGRFGGNHPTGVMRTCQDCHMPDIEGSGCGLGAPFPVRPDVPQHSFIGSNTWVLESIRSLFPDAETGLTEASVAAAKARNIDMLENASDLELDQAQSLLEVRVINQTGHKLPTGYPDGRRVWINIKFLDGAEEIIEERGAYDFATATLVGDGDDTVVFECRFGIDAAQSALTGLPEGDTYHIALANQIDKDNRIPPRGFSNVIAAQTNSEPIGETYLNGQHWHDSSWPIPAGAVEAVVTVYYQLTSREFIEFLRDANTTNDRGQLAHDEWVEHGRSQPVVMDMVTLPLFNPADVNQDGSVDFDDLLFVLSFWGPCPTPPAPCPMDVNNDGMVGFGDLLAILSNWGT